MFSILFQLVISFGLTSGDHIQINSTFRNQEKTDITKCLCGTYEKVFTTLPKTTFGHTTEMRMNLTYMVIFKEVSQWKFYNGSTKNTKLRSNPFCYGIECFTEVMSLLDDADTLVFRIKYGCMVDKLTLSDRNSSYIIDQLKHIKSMW